MKTLLCVIGLVCAIAAGSDVSDSVDAVDTKVSARAELLSQL